MNVHSAYLIAPSKPMAGSAAGMRGSTQWKISAAALALKAAIAGFLVLSDSRPSTRRSGVQTAPAPPQPPLNRNKPFTAAQAESANAAVVASA